MKGGLIALCAGDYHLVLEPARGGAINRFDWRGAPLLRASCGPSIFDAACFPLVPFSNRIARGAFRWKGTDVHIAPNFPDSDHPHPLHGFGWLAGWDVVIQSANRAVLRHRYRAGDWPWDYVAEQVFTLSQGGLVHELMVQNLSTMPMPAGLGFHPYFPLDSQTRYIGLHGAEWQTSGEGLPQVLNTAAHPIDWWHGQPVASRHVDTVYAGRDGPLTIIWPEQSRQLLMTPCEELGHTVVFSPVGADYFCVEPVSHMTDAVNQAVHACRPAEIGHLEVMRVEVAYRAMGWG